MAMTRRQLFGLTAGAAAFGGAGVGVGVWARLLPGRQRIGETIGLDGGPVPMPTEEPSAVTYGNFRSPHRPGVDEAWALSVPAGIPAKGLPVIIVLHGYGDSHAVPFTRVGYQNFQTRCVAEGAQPFALASLDGEHSYWHKRADGVDWARLVSDGLVGELDKLGLDTSSLGLMGWSMGGYGCLRLAADELHGRVKAVASVATATYEKYEDCPHPDAFDSKADHDANTLNTRIGQLQGLPLHLACGVNDFYYERNQWLAEQLHPEQTLFVKGAHDFDFWRRAASVQMRFVADRL
ncbi:MAG: hypothetical protein L0G49_11230 [Luteococcus sp.]|uniref:hypothetical protein n=1 Tax=Luteococcus sp. TaxID=1969402 RepID=UPI0026485D52|nr:hypothetical protein [Luteococcus sp.]MDN5564324.1 hypothetical protein [Luteococcus sp.]